MSSQVFCLKKLCPLFWLDHLASMGLSDNRKGQCTVNTASVVWFYSMSWCCITLSHFCMYNDRFYFSAHLICINSLDIDLLGWFRSVWAFNFLFSDFSLNLIVLCRLYRNYHFLNHESNILTQSYWWSMLVANMKQPLMTFFSSSTFP